MALDEKDLHAISALLDCKFEKELRPIKEDIAELKRDVSGLKQDMRRLEVRMDRLEMKMDSLEGRMDGLEVKIDRLEVGMDHLEKKVDGIDNRLKQVELRQEQEVIYKLDLLVENFIRTDRVTRLEENMEAMKESLSCVELALTDVASGMVRKSDNDICAVSV